MLLRPVGSAIIAELGPTNTGKTHHAIERLLTHESGMIGLPLRLLAREVYDRMTARVGEAAVALVTGEERRTPPRPRYWVCTVEAMPLDRPVDCVVIDEVQLAADRGRGHIFTDRILHARGRSQTIFCGARTIEPLLRRLVPQIETEERPRLSRLTYTGHKGIGSLPPRTAIVAFTADDVYALAERVRRRHGGAAVVLGALSPRARNAQAALFSSGEVPYLVATDAIGMGLNLEIEHVALSATRKFDGFEVRRLRGAELAQIAGRAGRFKTDGTFGVTGDEAELSPELVRQIEEHDFPPLKQLRWRASELDFSSLRALLHSLRRPPPSGALQHADPDDDEIALDALSRSAEVRARVRDEASVRLLWEVCRIPDFRKEPGSTHPELLRRVFVRLRDHDRLSAGWVLRQVEHLDRIDGDIETLMQRLLHVRTWTYIAHHTRWVEDADAVAKTARATEDLLSDTLHQRLTERFVDRRAQVGVVAPSAEVHGDAIRVGGRRVGELQGLVYVPDDPATEPGRAVLTAIVERLEARVTELVEAADPGLSMDDTGAVRWRGGAVARLSAGPTVSEPVVRAARNAHLGPAQVQRVMRRVEAWVRDEVARTFAAVRPATAPRGAVRGVLYALEMGLGTTPTATLPLLTGTERRELSGLGVRFGVEWTYSQPLLGEPGPRLRLFGVYTGMEAPRPPESPIAPRQKGIQDEAWRAGGYLVVGPLVVRVDQYEALTAALRAATKRGPVPTPPELAAFGEAADGAMRALGLVPGPAGWERSRRGGRGVG